jgi:hypothetical protein
MTQYFYPLMILLLLWQCNDPELARQTKEAAFGEEFTINREEWVSLSGEGEPLVLKLDEVIDSRCPSDVTCVWAGNVTVNLKGSNQSEKEKMLSMCIGDCRPDPFRSKHEINATIGNVKYKLTLLDVLPYPKSSVKEEKKSAKMIVEIVTE